MGRGREKGLHFPVTRLRRFSPSYFLKGICSLACLLHLSAPRHEGNQDAILLQVKAAVRRKQNGNLESPPPPNRSPGWIGQDRASGKIHPLSCLPEWKPELMPWGPACRLSEVFSFADAGGDCSFPLELQRLPLFRPDSRKRSETLPLLHAF